VLGKPLESALNLLQAMWSEEYQQYGTYAPGVDGQYVWFPCQVQQQTGHTAPSSALHRLCCLPLLLASAASKDKPGL
jgi:hypothetical protein